MKTNCRFLNNFLHTLESIWLCIRFPFLYPRNRFTNLHYTNWKIHKYLYGSDIVYTCVKTKDGLYKQIVKSPPKEGVRDKAFSIIFGKSCNDVKIIKSYFWATWFYIVEFYHKCILQIFHCIPTHTELDMMEPGWRKAFGIQMCKELKSQLKKDHYLYKYRITQIKEKWGKLCWYDEGHSLHIQQIIQKYSDLSFNTCLICGKPSTKITAGWISPYCDDCYPQQYKVYLEKINDKWVETKEYRESLKELE